jgi:LuxR family transcriptional regulator, quorum-sensing system regulator SdiA
LAKHLTSTDLPDIAPAGYYFGLRVRYAFPATETNELSQAWIDIYARSRFFLVDPALRWSFDNIGAARWSELADNDPAGMISLSARYGMRFGAVAAFNEQSGVRSYGVFFRDDREYDDAELEQLASFIEDEHKALAPRAPLTAAEMEVLRSIKGGVRIKTIAHELGVTEGAIKQRLRNARNKLGAATGAHAAVKASEFGII